MIKIAVLLGGSSEERDVSIASGAQIIKALRSINIEVVAIDTTIGLLAPEKEKFILSQSVKGAPPDTTNFPLVKVESTALWTNEALLKDIDVYFLALHGGTGEDGTLQALLDLSGIAYTGSGMLASACAMDKDVAKKIMRFHDIPTPPWVMAADLKPQSLPEFGFPAIVKPSKQGSTVGLTIARSLAELEASILYARKYGDDIIIEKFIPGRELTVGVLNGKAMAVGEVILPFDVEFDYVSKYQPGAVEEVFPAKIPDAVTRSVKSIAEKLHNALKMSCYSRADFRLDEQGNLWCLEANSLPGMTQQSLFPKSAAAEGISFPELCLKICESALETHRQKRRSKP